MDYGDDREEGQLRGMGMGLGGHVIGDHGYLANKIVHEEAAGNNCIICSRETNIQTVYRIRADGWFQ